MRLHEKTIARYTHSHSSERNSISNESRTLKVVILTVMTMVVEIFTGYFTGSMALLADGWHMGTHAFALGISYGAYKLARRYSNSSYFSFGSGKFGILAGYTSSLFLGLAAIWMIYESVLRFLNPINIAFTEAIGVAFVGLTVNLFSVVILHDKNLHSHHHGDEAKTDNCKSEDHRHKDDHVNKIDGHSHHDHNYRAAYLHVIADALTSILAIIALFSGRYLGWVFLDPMMGIVGGLLICKWAYSLLVSTGEILLDGGVDDSMKTKIKNLVEEDGNSKVSDLHVWRLGSHEMAAIISIVSGNGYHCEFYRSKLESIPNLTHISVEVNKCVDPCCSKQEPLIPDKTIESV